MPKMRAKFIVTNITPFASTFGEELQFAAVSEKPYDEKGASDDNSFAHWTPSGSLTMSVTNPDLVGKFKVGDKFYLDFTPAAE